MAITKIQSNAFPSSIDLSSVDITIGSGEITTANIADVAITHAKLHTDMDLSGKTVTLPSAITDTISNKLPLAGGTLTGNLNLGDNVKAQFGAGNDLQIYHDGSNSWIKDEGTGYLAVTTDGSAIYLQKGTSETLAEFGVDGACKFRYDNSTKLATTSTGIDVTGTVTADGLTVDKDTATSVIGSNLVSFGGTDYYSAEIELKDSSNRAAVLRSPNGIANARVGTTTNHQFEVITNNTLRSAFNSNGDISFYEDTGTTAKFFWDASAEQLFIGSTSGGGQLHVDSTLQTSLQLEHDTNGTKFAIDHPSGGSVDIQTYTSGAWTTPMSFKDGNVGINTTSPNATLHLGSGNAVGTETNPAIQIGGTSTYRLGLYTESEAGVIDAANGDDGLIIKTKTKGRHTVFRSSGAVWHPEYDSRGDYTSYIATISEFGTNGGSTGQYLHVQFSARSGSMLWIEAIGYQYLGSKQVYGRGCGYIYNTGVQSDLYSSSQNGDIVDMHQAGSNLFEIVLNTGTTSTGNRWGSYTFRGGTDTITSSIPIELVQYTWNGSTGRAFSS